MFVIHHITAYHISSLITSAISSAEGSPLSQNHEKKERFSRGLFLPDRAAAAAARWAAFAAKSYPSFQRIGVLCEEGSPEVPRRNSSKILMSVVKVVVT